MHVTQRQQLAQPLMRLGHRRLRLEKLQRLRALRQLGLLLLLLLEMRDILPTLRLLLLEPLGQNVDEQRRDLDKFAFISQQPKERILLP